MGTRANVARKNEDGSFDCIYTHWDGYPEHHAPILLENYSTNQRVQMLLDLGALSSLAEKIGEKHDFDDRTHDDWCMAYGRDRGEKNTEANHYKDGTEFAKMLEGTWTEWVYVWLVSEQQWYYTNNPSPTWFKLCGKDQAAMNLLSDWEKHEAETA